ncbi:hypothetical protein [Mycolicibacterium chlorophenolicum]|uniref:Uncharacterized protein n=1 Tax=Mycolicibacterium chlorophenolicum TaxID=37916 RepID=A0A0J6WLP6_9MYCO|nr:hypothetical protein [Mycolicibacterium chlorophenolicum]KMO82647.1 hypothetical protein MCHLDSM_01270 [Mycolicibacterium chlorophenolicum]
MSTTKITRQRVLRAAGEQHPVIGLIDQADGTATPPADNVATPDPAPAAPAPAPAAPAPTAPPAPRTPLAAETAEEHASKKQVNYRLDPALISELKKASLVHSYRQGRQISQNQIVETALREWLDANGPFDL